MISLYTLAVWVHLLTVTVWIGAMVFEDPKSVRMTSQIAHRIGGIGWYAQAALWSTGLLMLSYRGITPGRLVSWDFLSTPRGQVLGAKLALVLLLVLFQILVGNRPSKLVYGYILVSILIVGLSVVVARPFLLG
ncbi:MAG: hypothetical protein AB7O28_15330 [Vicinamibacterales bacterium]